MAANRRLTGNDLANYVCQFLLALTCAGRAYGMELHQEKFDLLQVNCNSRVYNTIGSRIASTSSSVYLGASLTPNGLLGTELSRLIGAECLPFAQTHTHRLISSKLACERRRV